MRRLLLVILIVVIATIFAIDNLHHVQVGLVVGRAVQVRLVFLLLTCFLIGCLSAIVTNLYLRILSNSKAKATQKTDGDTYFSD